MVGAGPAGLMACDVLLKAGFTVDLYDAMPSVGRKFLLAGKGGLNLTHAEPLQQFYGRFGNSSEHLRPLLQAFGPQQVREWAASCGVETFVGSSQRVFPVDMKAAPLLRSWLHRMRGQGLRVHARHRWLGLGPEGELRFVSPNGPVQMTAKRVILALGGGSWPHLGSDGAWQPVLQALGVPISPLRAANCGFDVKAWSVPLRSKHAGAPLKTVSAQWADAQGTLHKQRGECVLTDTGIEGGLVYAAAADLRSSIERDGQATLWLDLLPDHPLERVQEALSRGRGSRSLTTHLQTRLPLTPAKIALLMDSVPREQWANANAMSQALKHLPIELIATRPMAEAISSAGGVCFEGLTQGLELRALPGVFCAGEMLDWEAPTGGYLLTASLATGVRAAQGLLQSLGAENSQNPPASVENQKLAS